jgi:NAD(P)-dependent dehydrogenase (short-subunit alcohol dehydrogenase family)
MNRPVNTALVTGANGGIGSTITKQLAAAGWKVFAAVRSEAAAKQIREWGLERVIPVSLDVTNDGSNAAAKELLVAATNGGGLGGLINCAGIIVDGPLELVTVENFRKLFEVNVIAPFALTRALLPLLRTAHGRVVNIGAVSAHTTAPFFGPIAASKAALASLSDAMRMEFAPFGIDVVLIEPNGVKTPIWKTSSEAQEEGFKNQPSEIVEAYRPAIKAMKVAFATATTDRPETVSEAVFEALSQESRPKPRRLIGKGAMQVALVGRLPIRIRDRLLMSSLGISKSLAPAVKLLRAP